MHFYSKIIRNFFNMYVFYSKIICYAFLLLNYLQNILL